MIKLTPSVLASMPLPMPRGASDKSDRGQVLLVAGSQDVPGAAILCAEAALRAGAGKVQVVDPKAMTGQVGVALPETAVFGWDIGLGWTSSDDPLRSAAGKADAVLVGPVIMDEKLCQDLTEELLEVRGKMI